MPKDCREQHNPKSTTQSCVWSVVFKCQLIHTLFPLRKRQILFSCQTSKQVVGNCWPVALTSIIMKSLERIVKNFCHSDIVVYFFCCCTEWQIFFVRHTEQTTWPLMSTDDLNIYSLSHFSCTIEFFKNVMCCTDLHTLLLHTWHH